MKNIFRVFIITAGLVLFVNVNSFALVDGSAWGGFAFGGKTDMANKGDYDGYQYGAKAHYNMSLIPLLELGLGAYFENAKIKDVSSAGKAYNSDYIKYNGYGLDANLILTTPILHPYLRGTYAISDTLDTNTKKFKGYGYGAGLELSFLPFVRIYGEYMYKETKHDVKFTINEVNFGLKVDI